MTPDAPAPKPPSRRPRNAAATRERILDCATREFADRGFDGARIERIVRATGCNISLVYQYFGSKEKLFITVMEAAYATMRAAHRDIDIRNLDPVEAMATLVRSTFRVFIQHPQLIGLLASENVQRARHIAKSGYIRGLYNPLLDTIAGVLGRGADAGLFRRDVDPTDLFISLNGIGYFYLSNRYTLGVILNRDLMQPEALQHHEDHMVDVVLGYLRK